MMHPSNLSGAQSWSQLLTRILAALPPAVIVPVPLPQWSEEVAAFYAGKAQTTRLKAAQALRMAIGLAGPDATTEALTPELVARFAASRPEIRPATMDGLMRSLRAACNLAVSRGQLAGVPFSPETPWPSLKSVPALRSRHHSRAELARFLAALAAGATTWDGGRLYALGAVYTYCGLRRNEALRLRVEDVDFRQGILRVVRRNGKALKTVASEAAVPMPKALVAILKAWVGRCGSEWLFPGMRRRGPWVGGMVGKKPADRLKAVAASVGIRGLGPHTLRHSLATHLRGFYGLSPKQVQMILRHSNQYTQELYCHQDLENLGALVRCVDFGSPASSTRRRRLPPTTLSSPRLAAP
ncbi:MAG: site-specific recombinase XerD [Planctomycetota bacterium]|nr:site-specific recombinase XerD [Planctomycetota bacterium]